MRLIAIERAHTTAKTPIAYIRLRGEWLKNAGFRPGAYVRIYIISDGFIVMRASSNVVNSEAVLSSLHPEIE